MSTTVLCFFSNHTCRLMGLFHQVLGVKGNSLYHTAHFAYFRAILSYSVAAITWMFIGGIHANHKATCSPSYGPLPLWKWLKNSKKIVMESGNFDKILFLQKGESHSFVWERSEASSKQPVDWVTPQLPVSRGVMFYF